MSVLVKGWSIPTDGCCGCYFRTGKYCGILSKNERVLEYAERFTRPDNCPLTELIRCKDCQHYRPFITEPDVFHYCWLWSKRFKEDEYCARAKRKRRGEE